MGVKGIEQGTQHAAMQAEGRGCMGAHSYPLSVVCQKVLNPKAAVVWYSTWWFRV